MFSKVKFLSFALAFTALTFSALAEGIQSENGMHSQEWFAHDSFLDLHDDWEVANAQGKRLVVLFEQAGCIYCKRMHEEVLSNKAIADFVKKNFRIVQLDIWGSRIVTDFDGEELSEKEIARKWHANYTPGVFFFPTLSNNTKVISGKDLWVHRMDGFFGKITFTATFKWVLEERIDQQPLQRYVIENTAKIREMIAG